MPVHLRGTRDLSCRGWKLFLLLCGSWSLRSWAAALWLLESLRSAHTHSSLTGAGDRGGQRGNVGSGLGELSLYKPITFSCKKCNVVGEGTCLEGAILRTLYLTGKFDPI